MKPWAKVSFLDGVERRYAAVVINVAWCTPRNHKSVHFCARDSLLTLIQAAVLEFLPCLSSHLRVNTVRASQGERGATPRFVSVVCVSRRTRAVAPSTTTPVSQLQDPGFLPSDQ